VLAVSSTKRLPLMPDVPTLAEEGLPGALYNFWIGAFAPAKTPPAIAARLNQSFHDALKDPAVQDKLHQHATTVVTEGTSADFEAYARRDIAFYRGIVNATHMQLAKPAK